MRTLILISMVFSLSALAQTRVRENIKQQTIVDAEGVTKVIRKPVAPVKQIKQ